MRSSSAFLLFFALPLGLLTPACSGDKAGDDTVGGVDTADSADSADSGDSGDSGDSEETADSADTVDTGDSGDTSDSADSGDSGDSGASDADGDGFPVEDGDCDDADNDVYPGAVEICDDGIDNDCDGLAASCRPTSASVSTAIEYTGEATGDLAGVAVSGAGDVNADGYDDLVIGAFYTDSRLLVGAGYLVLGSAAPTSASLATALRYTGESAEDEAGYSVSGAGDVNGDGFDDFLIGAYQNDDAGADAGNTYLVLGDADPTGGSLSTAVQFTGEPTNIYTGYSVSGAGDINGDGLGDLLIGAPYRMEAGVYLGGAYLVLGSAAIASQSVSAALVFTGTDEYDQTGINVSGAGDVDGDGLDDLLIGSEAGGSLDQGATWLVLGATDLVSDSLDGAVAYEGEGTGDMAGRAVSGAGDINADGYADLVIGAYFNADSAYCGGAAYLVLGGSSPASSGLSSAVELRGEARSDFAGSAVSDAGDVDLDGYDDVLVGAIGNSDGMPHSGATYLVFGSAAPASASLSTAVEYTAVGMGDGVGWSASGAGDVDADGVPDLLLGAPYNGDAGATAGAAYLLTELLP